MNIIIIKANILEFIAFLTETAKHIYTKTDSQSINLLQHAFNIFLTFERI